MNVLLTTSAAPEKSAFSNDEKRPPLGLGFLVSVLRQAGHQVFFIDNYLAPSRFIEEGYLQTHQIDLVGIYANTICYRDTLRMFHAIESLRQEGKWQGKIAVGGPHTAVALETIPDFVDHVVLGEGEQAILSIVDGTTRDRLIWGERIRDFDTLPFQPWDLFTQLPYDDSCPWMDIRPVFTMNTSRGCPFQCAFCSVRSVWGAKYTYFSADRILAEIEYLVKEHGAQGIYFREDHFTLHEARTVEFCEKLIKSPLNIQWACETRVDALSEDLIRLMHASGCRAVFLGIESGSPRGLELLQKQITVEQIERAITLCKRHDIRTYCSLLVGTPGETFQDYVMTKRLMRKLNPYTYAFHVFVGLPGSQLYKMIVDQQLYEYMDDIGLAYLPGYDVKTQFFYETDSSAFVDYHFTQRTDFDRQLLRWQAWETFERFLIRKVLPSGFKEWLKNVLYAHTTYSHDNAL